MNLTIKKESASRFHKIYFQYRKDFPLIERRSYLKMIRTLKEGYSELLFLYSDKKIVGYAVVNVSSHYQYIIIDYIAVKLEYRNLGYGAKFLELLFDYYAEKGGILGEVERPVDATTEKERSLRQRRIEFYRRLGFSIKEDVQLNLWGQDYYLVYRPLKEHITDKKEMIRILLDLYTWFYNEGYQSKTNVEKYIRIIEK